MATVIKGNTLLTVPDDRVSDYLERGYSIASAAGTVIKKAVPTDLAELQKLYTNQVAEIANLKKQLEEQTELQANYDKLLASYEELEEKNQDLELELSELKAKKTTNKSKKTTE